MQDDNQKTFEAKLVVTVMGQDQNIDHFASWMSSIDLATLASEMDQGELIGQSEFVFIEELKPDQVNGRLLDLGNDGSFFDIDGDGDTTPKTLADARIAQSRDAQGWSPETMAALSAQFIERTGLSDSFARFLEDQAEFENQNSIDQDDLDGPT